MLYVYAVQYKDKMKDNLMLLDAFAAFPSLLQSHLCCCSSFSCLVICHWVVFMFELCSFLETARAVANHIGHNANASQ